jgi:1-deoxyxylulose-5-phosphate synthase
MPAWQFGKAQHTAELASLTRFTAMQNRYNLVNREEEREMIPLCLDQGVGVLPYSPLARGLLAGTRERTGERHTRRAQADRQDRAADFDVADAVRVVAAARGVPPAQVALAWLLAKPGVTAPIVGATRPGHLTDAVAATALRLTGDEIASLEAPYLPRLVTSYA